MRVLLSYVGLFAAILAGFFVNGGHIGLLWHPGEVIIIFGSAIAIMFMCNSVSTIKRVGSTLKYIVKPQYTADAYIEALQLMSELMTIHKNGGNTALSEHLSNTETSSVFKKYETISSNKDAVTFIVDNLSLLESGGDKLQPYELEAILEEEIDHYYRDQLSPANAMTALAEVMPSYGIISAVLGMDITMMYIDQEPMVIGEKIGAALYGTMLGIFLAYGIFFPLAHCLEHIAEEKKEFLGVLATFIMSFREKRNVFVAAEIARKMIPPESRIDRNDLRNKVASISRGE